ncbi:unnamed protein product [Adineta ricciae]|uniref:Uncharacterized protein n=1 Tax=Adineta ricciae TaxID=249248 RepID=A0A815YQ15_ADIRI|nr:unnamed protein product [Adineta ricciae]CAF1573644.1 unnamed protein product [Adineta ricciae]
MEYVQIVIDDIQFNTLHNLSYQLNLKAFDHTNIFEINILNSKEMQLALNQSSILTWKEIQLRNCSLTNVDFLIESLASKALAAINLSSNKLVHIPSLVNFTELTYIDFHNNFIEEIKSNIFTNLTHVYLIDLSYNRIKHIAHDAFVNLYLPTLLLHNNQLHSLESVTPHNVLTSFLYPINRTLQKLYLNDNFLHDFNPIRNLSTLYTLHLDNNQIKDLSEDSFKNCHQLETIQLNSNHIQSIHPLAFDKTVVKFLDLSSNLFSSLETTKVTYDEHFNPRNITTSFLDHIARNLITLSLANCTNLLEINWFVFTKLKALSHLTLSHMPKTEQFWFYQARNNTGIERSTRSSQLQIILNGIHFNNDDYCLSKPIFQILNSISLTLDINHPCNCFVLMFKNILDTDSFPICLTNQSIVDELTHQCMNIDSYCLTLTTSTTVTSTQSTSSLLSTTIPLTESSSSTSSSTRNTTIQITTVSTITEQPVTSSSRSSITTTNSPTTLGVTKEDGKWKTILAITIPLTVIIVVSITAIYIVKRQKPKKSREIIELRGFENVFTGK